MIEIGKILSVNGNKAQIKLIASDLLLDNINIIHPKGFINYANAGDLVLYFYEEDNDDNDRANGYATLYSIVKDGSKNIVIQNPLSPTTNITLDENGNMTISVLDNKSIINIDKSGLINIKSDSSPIKIEVASCKVEVTSSAINITGNVNITGNLKVNNKDFLSHIHTGVQSGLSNTGTML